MEKYLLAVNSVWRIIAQIFFIAMQKQTFDNMYLKEGS